MRKSRICLSFGDETLIFVLSLFLLNASCSFFNTRIEDPVSEEISITREVVPESDDRVYLREELANAKEDIKAELREMILEEILPEIWTAKQHKDNIEIKDGQQRAMQSAKEKTFIGRVEWVKWKDPEFMTQARIDSGAKTCSIHAENIKEVQINGEPFVQFETLDDDENRYTIVRRVVAKTKVKNTSGKTSSRFVIRATIRLGNNLHDINVNLNDRTKLNYKFLVGRNLLIGNYIVDVSESHLLGEKL
jgi:hypothetical protein